MFRRALALWCGCCTEWAVLYVGPPIRSGRGVLPAASRCALQPWAGVHGLRLCFATMVLWVGGIRLPSIWIPAIVIVAVMQHVSTSYKV